ncbi:MAG: S-methyl-5'-thioadenosine phosphorylase [Candidatus Eremiobacteraeota bacterium]|nr:S-methyl-5'-thioadenosine phosphorylase [Candidatus Eremiobacteraeota bacterium]
MKHKADIGVFGGSGFYSFLDNMEEIVVQTPYGPTSDMIAVGTINGRPVAFLPRHGKDHSLPPHRIPYRANIWAMKALGVKHLIGPCAAGSLKKEVKPGDFVLCDQFVDRTKGRIDTFYDGPVTTHVSAADPYCPELRKLAYKVGTDLGITVHESGTMVVIQGPRFSTRAESKWFSKMGWSVINMTGYPEAYLASELEMCYVNISLITDYDVGVLGEEAPVSHDAVMKVFNKNVENVKKMIIGLIKVIPEDLKSKCQDTLSTARLSDYRAKTFMPGII